MIITFTNVIGAIRNAFSVVRSGLKMWLGFQTSETLGRELAPSSLSIENGSGGGTITQISENSYSSSSDGNNSSTIRPKFDFNTESGKTYKLVITPTGTISGTVHFDFNDGVSYLFQDYDFTTTKEIYFTDNGLVFGAFNGQQVYNITGFTISVKELTQITPDKSGNNNVGELFTGKALELDGVNDEINFGASQIPIKTISFWIKPLSVSNEGLFYLGLSGFPQFRQISITSGNISATSYLTNFTPYVNNIQTSAVTQDVWQRVVLTFDEWTTTSLQIGKVYSSVYGHFAISDVQFYNETWSTDDIAYDYANPNKLAIDNPSTSLNVTNLKAYWALSEGDGLVAYDSGTNLEEEEVQNGTFNLGSEEVVDGDFPLPNVNWIALAGATIESNGARINNTVTGGVAAVKQAISNPSGKTFEFTYDITATDGSTLVVQQLSNIDLDTATVGTNRKITFTWDLGIDDLIIKRKSGTTDVTIDNVSLKEVPNWELLNGATISDNKANIIGDGSSFTSIKQVNVFENNKRYKITADVTITSGLGLKFQDGANNENIGFAETTGVYTFNFTGTSNADLVVGRRTAGTAFDSSVNSISVREVTASDHGGILNGATYVDAQPRIPQLGMMNWSKGSNLFSYSQNFNLWNKEATVTLTPNYGTSPSGANDSTRIQMDANDSLYLSNAGSSKTFSIYVKGTQGETIRLSNGVTALFTLTGDWDRIQLYDTSGASVLYSFNTYSGATARDMEIWGGQLEDSSSASAYRLTDGAATLNSTVIPNPTTPTKDIFGNLVRDRLNSFNLDGSGYAEVADDTDLDFGTGDFTLECWAKYDFLNQGSGWNVLVSNGSISSSGGSGFSLASSISSFSIRLNAGTAVTKSFGTDNMTVGNWYHLVVTREGTTLTTYRDTSLKSSSTIISVDVDTSLPVRIGRDTNTNRFYQNLISDVRLYDRALTSDEIENNYNAGLSVHRN